MELVSNQITVLNTSVLKGPRAVMKVLNTLDFINFLPNRVFSSFLVFFFLQRLKDITQE